MIYIVSVVLIITYISFLLNLDIKDWSQLITAFMAIGGVIIAYSYNNGMKNQREQQLLQNKREYYNKFWLCHNKWLILTRNSV